MQYIGALEHQMHDKLIFKSLSANSPPLGVSVSKLGKMTNDQKPRHKVKIGKIIDVFGPVNQPWIVVKLQRNLTELSPSTEFIWEKRSQKNQKNLKSSRKGQNQHYKSKKMNFDKKKNTNDSKKYRNFQKK